LANDLNNSPAVIFGACELLGSLLSSNAEAMKQTRVILQAAKRIGDDLCNEQFGPNPSGRMPDHARAHPGSTIPLRVSRQSAVDSGVVADR
jgi:hypothetical protein